MNNIKDATHMVNGEYGIRYYMEKHGCLFVWHSRDEYWTPAGYTSLKTLKAASAFPVTEINQGNITDGNFTNTP